MVPMEKERFRIAQFSFKLEEVALIDKILLPIFTMLKKLGMENYFEDGVHENLKSASLKDLMEISTTWEKLSFDLETVHFKCAVTKEYYLINNLVGVANRFVSQISDIVEKLEQELKVDYSQIVNANDFFSNYFSYKEFKNTFLILTSPETINMIKASELKNENMFKLIRRKIISDKANIGYLLSEGEKNIIHINDIKKQDLKTFDLIRSEFFVTLCEESMGMKIGYGKKSKTEIIRPSHASADKMKMQRSEIIYLTISLEPIENSELEGMDVIEFNNGSKFEVVVPQQMVHRDMFYQLKLDKLSTCNLIVPVYFSFIRCNLVKEQRSNYAKLNDNKFLDELSNIIPLTVVDPS
jgi:hypothetical protein